MLELERKIERYDRISRYILVAMFLIMVVGFSVGFMNQRRLLDRTLAQAKQNEQTAIDNRAESQRQHDTQDAKFTCMIKLFAQWTINNAPVVVDDIDTCSVSHPDMTPSASAQPTPARQPQSSSASPAPSQSSQQPQPPDERSMVQRATDGLGRVVDGWLNWLDESP